MANIFIPHVIGDRKEKLRAEAAYKKKITNRENFVFELEKWLLSRRGEYHRYMDKADILTDYETGTVIVKGVCKSMSFYKNPENWNIGLDMKVIPGRWYNQIKESEVFGNFNKLSNSNVIKNKEPNNEVDSMLTFETITIKQAEAYNELKIALMSEQFY